MAQVRGVEPLLPVLEAGLFPKRTYLVVVQGVAPRQAPYQSAVLLLDDTTMEGNTGIEPVYSVWQTDVMPLYELPIWRNIRDLHPFPLLGRQP